MSSAWLSSACPGIPHSAAHAMRRGWYSWASMRVPGSTWKHWWRRAWPSARPRTGRRLAGPGSATARPPTPLPGGATEAAGREWGAYMTEQPPPYQKLTAGQAITWD